jgi:hypothetical protein
LRSDHPGKQHSEDQHRLEALAKDDHCESSVVRVTLHRL